MTDTSKKHPFSSDRPITSVSEDLLGRTEFAYSLASAIRGWKGNDSLVIALFGSWGSGKSSIKNLLVECLRQSPKTSPEIVEFNPWQWAGQEQLAEAFFREIGVVLGRSDTSRRGKQRAAQWRIYGTYLTIGASVAKSLKVVLPFLGIPGSNILELAAQGLQQSAEATKQGSEGLTARTEAQDRSHGDIKKDLLDSLKTLKRSILVVVDDVDRLSTDEIKLLFQLVKANADFPNLIYLLLFQRDIVERSLEKLAPITGREFLEKIVQVGFDVPQIERPRLEKVLFAGLDELLRRETVGQRFNRQRWQNLFIPGLRPYFETLRGVYRYLAVLSFHVSLFQEKGSFNVNPIDLTALEVLRVFEPEIYQALPKNKSVLTEQPTSLSRDWGDETRKWVTSVFDKLPESRREQAREILRQVFPKVDWALRNQGYGSGFEDGWFRDLRACHSDLFDRYFHFGVPEGDISQAELDLLLSLVGDRDGLVAEFRSLKQRGLLEVALDRIEAYKEKIDLKYAEAFVTAIFDIGDDLRTGGRGFFEMQPDMHAIRIIHWYLKQEKDPAKRAEILKRTMKLTQGVYLPVMQTSLEDSKQERKQDPDALIVTGEGLEDLRKICLEKIRVAAENGKLKAHPKMAYMLYRWREWVSPEEPKEWVQQLVRSKDGLLCFLKGLVQEGSVSGSEDYAARVYRYMSRKSVEDFVAPEIVEEGIKQTSLDELTEDEKQAVRAFQKAIARRREGKPDDDWGRDSEEE
jgi:predicted KAP-like P-loop ATPase